MASAVGRDFSKSELSDTTHAADLFQRHDEEAFERENAMLAQNIARAGAKATSGEGALGEYRLDATLLGLPGPAGFLSVALVGNVLGVSCKELARLLDHAQQLRVKNHSPALPSARWASA